MALGWEPLLHQPQPRNPGKSVQPQAPRLWPCQGHSSAGMVMPPQRSGWAFPALLALLKENPRPQPGPDPWARPGPLTTRPRPRRLPPASESAAQGSFWEESHSGELPDADQSRCRESCGGPQALSNPFPAGVSPRAGGALPLMPALRGLFLL